MGCLKCGRDIPEGQLFCESCLDVMKKYPVKPNTAILLPHTGSAASPKKPAAKRRQAPTAEEKLLIAKRYLRRILVLWLITLGLLIISLYPAVKYIVGDRIRLPGQNYSTFSTVPAESAPATDAATTPAVP